MRAIGIAIPFIRRRSGAAVDAQAQAHFDRVIADGGLVPSGLSGVNAFFTTVKSIYATSDITTAISVGLDAQVLGYKLGAGAGTTLGQAAQKLYSCSGASGDVVQTTAASQPLLLVHSGENYWFGSSVSSNYLSTPNAASNNFTGDIEIVVCAKAINWSAAYQVFAAKADNTGSGMFFFSTGGTNVLFYSTIVGGSLRQVASSASIPFANGTTGWLKLTHNTSNGDVIFYTSTDGITFTQLGTTQNVTSGARNSNTKVVTIGSEETGTSRLFGGSIYKLTISNSIGGTPVVDFNPNQYNAATSQTQWTSSTGEIWTINTATTNNALKGALVDRTYVMGNGTSMGLSAASLNINKTAITSYTAFEKYSNGAGENMIIELGTNANVSQGFNLLINGFAGFESQNIFANVGRYNNNYSNNTLLLGLRTGVYNINNANEADPYLLNNSVIASTGSSATNNNTAAMNATGYNLLNRNNASLFANVLFSSNIVANQEDNSTIRAAMYNYIRSINNNAF
jgi:hypothetical protein